MDTQTYVVEIKCFVVRTKKEFLLASLVSAWPCQNTHCRWDTRYGIYTKRQLKYYNALTSYQDPPQKTHFIPNQHMTRFGRAYFREFRVFLGLQKFCAYEYVVEIDECIWRTQNLIAKRSGTWYKELKAFDCKQMLEGCCQFQRASKAAMFAQFDVLKSKFWHEKWWNLDVDGRQKQIPVCFISKVRFQ